MGYTVKDLLESNKFPEMQLISDDSGIDREIKGVRIIEVADMEKFLGGDVYKRQVYRTGNGEDQFCCQ